MSRGHVHADGMHRRVHATFVHDGRRVVQSGLRHRSGRGGEDRGRRRTGRGAAACAYGAATCVYWAATCASSCAADCPPTGTRRVVAAVSERGRPWGRRGHARMQKRQRDVHWPARRQAHGVVVAAPRSTDSTWIFVLSASGNEQGGGGSGNQRSGGDENSGDSGEHSGGSGEHSGGGGGGGVRHAGPRVLKNQAGGSCRVHAKGDVNDPRKMKIGGENTWAASLARERLRPNLKPT
ncbi:hypothetical protein GGX14DRAFT_403732 [Mycena pura]|uniref:Uncharacterized protein n=1 Tax=Mycena pura TaxID=153505 RepID=A0AAD6Y857_9AGAR|nr:hypothetical protein GGX14DRAFT_403732 [Mycena pura]